MLINFEVIFQLILIVLSVLVLATIVRAHKSKFAYCYYGAYSLGCFVMAGWIAFAIYYVII